MLLDAQAGNYAVGAFSSREYGNGHGGYGSSRGVKIQLSEEHHLQLNMQD